jgi:HlyD family secretion protein
MKQQIIKIILPILSVFGIGIAFCVIAFGSEAVDPNSKGTTPASLSAPRVISGAGLVEAKSRNIKVATFFSGVIDAVNVTIGDRIEKDSVLFSVDTRNLQAQRELSLASLEVSKSEFKKASSELELIEPLYKTQNQAISKETYIQRTNALLIAENKVKEAQRRLDVIDADLERSIVRSPISGEVLQVNIRRGEYVSALTAIEAPVIVGDTSTLFVRTDFDENDALRIKSHYSAKAFLKGNSAQSTSLHFEKIEPMVIPKRSLTGDSAERVDTRVLQVLYSFDPKLLPIYVGQQVDVLVEEN